ncbi:MAG TPA: hypothetical protein ENK60_02485 [Anaerolineae bacterium]|nr:hypothetical protein [Anaerolineae bacterium]
MSSSFIGIGEPWLVAPALKIALVNQETGRPVDRVGERIDPISLVSWFTGFLGYIARHFHRYRHTLAHVR